MGCRNGASICESTRRIDPSRPLGDGAQADGVVTSVRRTEITSCCAGKDLYSCRSSIRAHGEQGGMRPRGIKGRESKTSTRVKEITENVQAIIITECFAIYMCCHVFVGVHACVCYTCSVFVVFACAFMCVLSEATWQLIPTKQA